jgi:putative endonuclease
LVRISDVKSEDRTPYSRRLVGTSEIERTEMKGLVYILLNSRNNYYIGSTSDLSRRLKEHKSGKVISTRPYLPIKCVLSQKYLDIRKARRVELKLKRLKRRDYIDKIVSEQKIKMAA